jgi:hypothetical protein
VVEREGREIERKVSREKETIYLWCAASSSTSVVRKLAFVEEREGERMFTTRRLLFHTYTTLSKHPLALQRGVARYLL